MKVKVLRCKWDSHPHFPSTPFYFVRVNETFLFVEPQSPGYIYHWVGMSYPTPLEEISKLEFLVIMGQTPESVWEKGKHLRSGQNNRRDTQHNGNVPAPVED
jgi:hypothetical protein